MTPEEVVLNHTCRCETRGHCTTFNRLMSDRQWQICSDKCDPPCNPIQRIEYLKRWAKAVLPSPVQQAVNYGKAVAKYAATLGRKTPLEVQEARLAKCRECPHRVPDPDGRDKEGRCSLRKCGCLLTHKTSWASESCPDSPPRWGKWDPEKKPPEEEGEKWKEGNNVRTMKWAYGVTTVPARVGDLLPRTLDSLRTAGFDRPRLFVDGADSPRPYLDRFPGSEVTVRHPKLRTYGNWIISLAELYVRSPNFDRYSLFQDDFVTYRNLRGYLERCPFPENGYWNLYTFMENEKLIRGGPIGWTEARPLGNGRTYHGKVQQGGRGAVALTFSRKGVLDLLTHQHIVHRPQDVANGWKRVDGAVVEAMNRAGYREYVHNPSLVQHVGRASTMGNRPHRPAESFRGEDFDALELLKEQEAANASRG